MDTMDRLFELYNADFDRIEQDMRALNRKRGAPDPNKMWLQRFAREQFDAYLAASTRQTETRRLFVLQLLEGHENLKASLPPHLISLLNMPRDASPPRKSVA